MRHSIGIKNLRNYTGIHRIFHRISGLFLPLFVFIFLLYGGYKALQNTHTEILSDILMRWLFTEADGLGLTVHLLDDGNRLQMVALLP